MSVNQKHLRNAESIYSAILSKNLGYSINNLEELKEADDFTIEHITNAYSDDLEHKKRLKYYLSNKFFWPSTPIVSNLAINNQPYTGAPIACFLTEVDQTNLAETLYSTATITNLGGGLGILLDVPTMSEYSNYNSKNYGFVSIIKTLALTMRINAGKARDSGSLAVYMRIDHGDIERFITMRQNKIDTDPEQFIPPYVHHGVIITDKFLDAVKNNESWDLIDSKNNVIKSLSARSLMMKIAQVRFETGEPFVLFIDNANKSNHICNKVLKLPIKTSNLCTEILLPTGKDHRNQNRIAICCLGSVNITTRDQWLNIQDQFAKDILRMYDNIISYFINMTNKYKIGDIITDKIEPGFLKKYKLNEEQVVYEAINSRHPMAPALYAAYRSRDLGIGVCGLSRYLSHLGYSIDDDDSYNLQEQIFTGLKKSFDKANRELGEEYGSCPDILDYNNHVTDNQKLTQRFVNIMAIAPTSTLSIACNTSKSIEPEFACSIHKSASGSVALVHPKIVNKLNQQGITDINQQINYINNHSDQLDPLLQKLLRTPYQIKQQNLIKLAANRYKHICQGQSLNLWYHQESTQSEIINDIIKAGRLGIKTLYYCHNTPALDTQDYRINFSQQKENCDININDSKICEIVIEDEKECLLCQ